MKTPLSESQTASLLLENDNFIILTHVRPDGDTVGSSCALCTVLRAVGKTAFILQNPDITPKFDAYLTHFAPPQDFKPCFIISVDIANTVLIPKNAAEYAQNINLVIDHHTENNIPAGYILSDKNAAAAGELVYAVAKQMCGEIPATAAEGIYIALSTDTCCFKYSNTTPRTHEIAAEVMRAGADAAYLNKTLFETKTLARVRIEKEIYNNLQIYDGGKIAVINITQDMMRRTGAAEDDIDDLSSLSRQIEGVLVGVTIREMQGGVSKVSLRSQGRVNSAEICAEHGGGGHMYAAGCSFSVPYAQAEQLILESIRKVVG